MARLATAAAVFWICLAVTTLGAATTRPGLSPGVDRRVELLCIIFRLAGHPEYQRAKLTAYTREVDRHFAPFAQHAVVKLAQELRRTRGVSYDAPMSLAAQITDPPGLEEAVAFEPLPAGLDGRWRLEEVRRFLAEARDFARQSGFEAFFKDHQALYDLAAGRMSTTLEQHAHLEWFEAFFGARPDARFHLALGMLNGGNCYGARRVSEGQTDMYCILGVWTEDGQGQPAFPKSVLPTVIHEFGHSFVNPIVDQHLDQLESAGKKLFAQNEKIMRSQAYGQWQTVLRESVLRACVVRYRLAHDGMAAGAQEIAEQHARGFVWTGALAQRLAEYEQQRATYPTFESFMPRIVEFFEEWANRPAP